MATAFRLFVVSTSVATTVLFWVSLVQAQQTQPPQRQPTQPHSVQPPQQLPSQDTRLSQLRDRVARAVQRVQEACRTELSNFCGNVTPGEGRTLLCMQAHEDKISQQCGMALYEVSRNVAQTTHRIERIAEACWNDIQARCLGGGPIAQCVIENRASMSPPCQTAISAMLPPQQQASQTPQQPSKQAGQQAGQQSGPQTAKQAMQQPDRKPNLVGLPIYGIDGSRLGDVTAVQLGPDGSVQAIQAELSNLLGLGTSSVLISPDDLQVRENHLELPLAAEQVRTILLQQRQ